MLAGLYSAAAGMAAQQTRIDGVANDLANTSTTGYKHVRVGFRDLLYGAQGDSAGPTVLAGSGAAAAFIGRAQAQGPLQPTGQPLDLAVQGPGFFQVRRADGTLALTRDGSFRLDATGRLTTKDGHLVEPGITLPRGTTAEQLGIAADGTVRAGTGAPLGRIQLGTVAAPDGLRALGANLFEATADSGPTTPLAPGASEIRQGALEGSNVDVADAMVDMIDAQRSFQLASKAIQMQDQMMDVANQVKR
jgi:flagellar basal-body rod protein FlgG